MHQRPMLSVAALSLLVLVPTTLGACGAGDFSGAVTARRGAAVTIDDQVADCNEEQDEALDPADIDAATQTVSWEDGNGQGTFVPVRLLALNDFHGQISKGKKANGRPAGGAAVLAAYLKAAKAATSAPTFITSSGDFVGASPPASGLLEDEPAIMFMNQLTNSFCNKSGDSYDPTNCNVIAAVGNHEFDRGRAELFRKINGGNSASGPYLQNPYPGANFPWLAANVVDSATGAPILPPYQIKNIGGESIAFIGVVTMNTPNVTVPSGVAGLTFLDEATAVNKYVPAIQQQGVHAIVVLLHEGGRQHTYSGSTIATGLVAGKQINKIVSALDGDVDVVLSGHSHAFTNALLPNAAGKPTLVTQAFSYSTAFANVDLRVSTSSHDVIAKSAAIVMAYGDAGPGLSPDPGVASLVAQAEYLVAPKVNQVVGSSSVALTARPAFPLPFTTGTSPTGETNFGDVIADAQRAAMGTQIAFMNPGGIRTDLPAGSLTWGQLYSAQPFSNNLVAMSLTGAQLLTALEQQWGPGASSTVSPPVNALQISGLSYTWSATPLAPDGAHHVSSVTVNGAALNTSATYSVTVNSFLAGGGDGFKVLLQGTGPVTGPVDLDALVAWVKAKSPITQAVEGRINRSN